MDAKTEQITDATVRAVITRADGTVHDLGVVDATYRNPLKQLAWRVVGRPLSRRRIRRANRRARKAS